MTTKTKYFGIATFTHKDRPNCTLDVAEMYANHNAKIRLIKQVRGYTGLGLIEAKGMVEDYTIMGTSNPVLTDVAKLLTHLYQHAEERKPVELSKEQILQIFDDALEAAPAMFYSDPLEVIIQTAKNIQDQGGLQQIAEHMDNFIHEL